MINKNNGTSSKNSYNDCSRNDTTSNDSSLKDCKENFRNIDRKNEKNSSYDSTKDLVNKNNC